MVSCAHKPTGGVVMVARQHLRVGRTHAGRIVTIYVEDTHFRVSTKATTSRSTPARTSTP
jgi:hypothetical protein